MSPRLAVPAKRKAFIAISAVYLVTSCWLVWNASAILDHRQRLPDFYKGGCDCAITWCCMFPPSDFHSVSDVVQYLRDLRAAIPPLLSLAEIAVFHLTGSMDSIAKPVYSASLIMEYCLALPLVRFR